MSVLIRERKISRKLVRESEIGNDLRGVDALLQADPILTIRLSIYLYSLTVILDLPLSTSLLTPDLAARRRDTCPW